MLLFKLKDTAQRLGGAAKTLEQGWSRAVLTVQIESALYRRHGKAISTLAGTPPAPKSDLAQQSRKDPYLFDFLILQQDGGDLGREEAQASRHRECPWMPRSM